MLKCSKIIVCYVMSLVLDAFHFSFLLKIFRTILAPRFFLCLISFFFKIFFSSQFSKCFDILPKRSSNRVFSWERKQCTGDVVFTTFSTKPVSPIHQFPNFQIFNSADIVGWGAKGSCHIDFRSPLRYAIIKRGSRVNGTR